MRRIEFLWINVIEKTEQWNIRHKMKTQLNQENTCRIYFPCIIETVAYWKTSKNSLINNISFVFYLSWYTTVTPFRRGARSYQLIVNNKFQWGNWAIETVLSFYENKLFYAELWCNIVIKHSFQFMRWIHNSFNIQIIEVTAC